MIHSQPLVKILIVTRYKRIILLVVQVTKQTSSSPANKYDHF
jgi:hypothetical protein